MDTLKITSKSFIFSEILSVVFNKYAARILRIIPLSISSAVSKKKTSAENYPWVLSELSSRTRLENQEFLESFFQKFSPEFTENFHYRFLHKFLQFVQKIFQEHIISEIASIVSLLIPPEIILKNSSRVAFRNFPTDKEIPAWNVTKMFLRISSEISGKVHPECFWKNSSDSFQKIFQLFKDYFRNLPRFA